MALRILITPLAHRDISTCVLHVSRTLRNTHVGMGKEARWLGKRRCPAWPLPTRNTLLTLVHLTCLIVKAVFGWHGLTFSLTIQKEIRLFLCTRYQSNASSHQHTILGHVVYKNLKARVQAVRRSLHERGCYSNILEEEST